MTIRKTDVLFAVAAALTAALMVSIVMGAGK